MDYRNRIIVSGYLDSIKLNPELWKHKDAKKLRDFVQYVKQNPELFPDVADTRKDAPKKVESTADPAVKAFFQKLQEKVEWGCLDEETKDMIQQNPKLLEAKCPNDDEFGNWHGHTPAECMCVDWSAGSRDLMVELAECGAQATKECYEQLFEDGVTISDMVEALLITGYMPLTIWYGRYFLDILVEDCDDDPMDILHGCMKLIHHETVQVGDEFGFGEISATLLENLRNLPNPQWALHTLKEELMKSLKRSGLQATMARMQRNRGLSDLFTAPEFEKSLLLDHWSQRKPPHLEV